MNEVQLFTVLFTLLLYTLSALVSSALLAQAAVDMGQLSNETDTPIDWHSNGTSSDPSLYFTFIPPTEPSAKAITRNRTTKPLLIPRAYQHAFRLQSRNRTATKPGSATYKKGSLLSTDEHGGLAIKDDRVTEANQASSGQIAEANAGNQHEKHSSRAHKRHRSSQRSAETATVLLSLPPSPLSSNETLDPGSLSGPDLPTTTTAEAIVWPADPKPIKWRQLCEKLTDKQKYGLLERIGGRNQLFMANTPGEAAHFFPRLLPVAEERHWADFEDDIPNFDDETATNGGGEDGIEDGERRGNAGGLSRPVDVSPQDAKWGEEIEWKLADALEKKRLEEELDSTDVEFVNADEPVPTKAQEDPTGLSATTIDYISATIKEEEDLENSGKRSPRVSKINSRGENPKNPDHRHEEHDRKVKKQRKRHCLLEKFIPIGNCTIHGKEETWGHEKLCTACQGVYVLNEECFPTFINSVICDKYDRKCIFDRYSGAAQGRCQTKTLSFKVMRNDQNADGCENWVFEYIDVPVACECYLNKDSWLEAQPLPDARIR